MIKKIKNAVIIHGPGRSGTTLLDNILSRHQDFYWISGYLNKYPNYPSVSVLNRLTHTPVLEAQLRQNKFLPRPNEAYNFWTHYLSGFNSDADIIAKPKEVEHCLKTLKRVKKYASGNRFTTKLTGAARAHFIDALFEDPFVVWIDRDPQAVIMSYFKQKWFYKNREADRLKMTNKELITQYADYLERIVEEKKTLTGFRFLQLYYEDMILDTPAFFKELCSKIDLEYNPNFSKLVKNWGVYAGANQSYSGQLDAQDQAYLYERSRPIARKMGYS